MSQVTCENCVRIIQGMKRTQLNQKHDITNLQLEISKRDELIQKLKTEKVNSHNFLIMRM